MGTERVMLHGIARRTREGSRMIQSHATGPVHQRIVCDVCLCDGPVARFTDDIRREAEAQGWHTELAGETADVDMCPGCWAKHKDERP